MVVVVVGGGGRLERLLNILCVQNKALSVAAQTPAVAAHSKENHKKKKKKIQLFLKREDCLQEKATLIIQSPDK